MRFLGVGETVDLGDMYLRLQAAGHEVRVHASDTRSQDVMRGMLHFTDDWQGDLAWVRDAGPDGIILFETASAGATQDDLRRAGYNVVGGSEYGDRLEHDREYGQAMLREAGLRTAESRSFESFEQGIAFARSTPGRYVFKLNGSNWSSTRAYAGQMEDGADMVALLTASCNNWTADDPPSFVLMDYVSGVEVGVGAFFNGEKFLSPANLDWEHKRFFPGEIGELTGEMGTVVTYRGAERIFEASLARMAQPLRESGYCGYINLNTIINDDGIWPLEFTCRFGYPGFPILDALHLDTWDRIHSALVTRDRLEISVRDGYSVGVVVTVPPFPYSDGYAELGKGTPIGFREPLSDADRDSIHYAEVTLCDGQLVTAGMIGYIMVVTGVGTSVEDARRAAYERVAKVVIPNARYRNDIGMRLIDHDQARLRQLNWLD